MPRKKAPDSATRPPLPEGYIYDKHGRPISPSEQFENVETAIFEEEWKRFERAFDKKLNRLSQAERDARVRRVKQIVESVIKEVTGSAIEPRAEDAGEPEKRSWAKDTSRKRGERGDRQRD